MSNTIVTQTEQLLCDCCELSRPSKLLHIPLMMMMMMMMMPPWKAATTFNKHLPMAKLDDASPTGANNLESGASAWSYGGGLDAPSGTDAPTCT
jgi:hypothetical protein